MQLFRIKFTSDPQLDSEGFTDSPLRNITQADRNIINELWPNESRRERCSMGQYEQQAARCDRERCEGCIPNEVCYCEQTYKAPAQNPAGWQHAEGACGIVALPAISWADMDQMDLDRAHAEWLATGKDLRQYADRRVKDRRTPRR